MVLSNFPLDFNTGTGIDYCYWKIKHKAIFKKYIVMPIKYKLQYTHKVMHLTIVLNFFF